MLSVEDCQFATVVHKKLKPIDVTCPYALSVMALFQKFVGEKVFVANSEYYDKETKTRIRPECKF